MLIHKAYKFRLYPTAEQATLINKTIGCSRFVFNHFLSLWNNSYQETGKGLSYNQCSKQLPQLKKEYIWLKEPDSIHLTAFSRNKMQLRASKANGIVYNATKQNTQTGISL